MGSNCAFGLDRLEGSIGERVDCGRPKVGEVGDTFIGESGGADAELRLRLDLRATFVLGGRTGDEDSAPD